VADICRWRIYVGGAYMRHLHIYAIYHIYAPQNEIYYDHLLFIIIMGYHHYKKRRLQNYNYGKNGYYFITICTKNRKPFFGKIINDKMKLSNIGKIAQQCYREIPNHFNNVKLDEYVIMPDHIHGIIMINNGVVGGALVATYDYTTIL